MKSIAAGPLSLKKCEKVGMCPLVQRRQKYPNPSLRQKLKSKTKTTFFVETKAIFSLEAGRRRETETKN